MAVSCIGGGNRSTPRKPPTCHKSLTNFITQCCIEYISPSVRFKFTTLVVIGIDCIGSCKSNYHMITTTAAPNGNRTLMTCMHCSMKHYFLYFSVELSLQLLAKIPVLPCLIQHSSTDLCDKSSSSSGSSTSSKSLFDWISSQVFIM